MALRFTLDSNALTYAFFPPDAVNQKREKKWKQLHSNAKLFWDSVVEGRHTLVTPSLILLEVAVASSKIIRGQLLSKGETQKKADEEAEERSRQIVEIIEATSEIVEPNRELLMKAATVAVRTHLNSFDTFIATSSIERFSTLVTNDEDLNRRLERLREANNPDIRRFDVMYFEDLTETQIKEYLLSPSG